MSCEVVFQCWVASQARPQTRQPNLSSGRPRPRMLRKVWRCGDDPLTVSVLADANMAVYSVIFTLTAAAWFGRIESSNENISTLTIFHSNISEQSPGCSAAQQFIGSVRFEECRSLAWSRLTERAPPYPESVYHNNNNNNNNQVR